MERTSIGSRLFNTIVVLGMGLSANACSTNMAADTGTTGDTGSTADTGSSTDTGSNTDTGGATDSATDTGTIVADAADVTGGEVGSGPDVVIPPKKRRDGGLGLLRVTRES